MEQLIKQLRPILESKVVYLQVIPDIFDFTQPFDGIIRLSNSNCMVDIKLSDIRCNSFLTVVQSFKGILLTYDIKKLLTYFKYKCNLSAAFEGKLIDIKVIEAFLGTNNKSPVDFAESLNRFKQIANDNSWKNIYKEIHYPLITSVIPSIESRRTIVDRDIKYTFYEIEGQKSGRLSTLKPGDKYITPHSIDANLSQKIKPSGFKNEIITFDFKQMEVFVLQWLSKDEKLMSLLEGDFYFNLYKDLFGKDCSDSSRKRMKLIFLPMIYGAGAEKLSENTGVEISTMAKIVGLIRNKFSDLFNWLETQDVPIDFFGRKRQPEYKYLIRNFLVQSPAAMICQHKLIQLFKKHYDIIFSIHDAYVVQLALGDTNSISDIVDILEAEEQLYPGLKLKVSYHKGV